MIGTKRAGRGFVADYRLHGKRVRLSFDTARERDAHLDEIRDLERRHRGMARDVDRRMTVAVYAARWLASIRGSVKPRTFEAYSKAVALYIAPLLGDRLVVELRRRDVKAFLRECRHLGVGYVKLRRTRDGATVEERVRRPLAQGSVYAIYAALRAMLFEAVEDEIIPGNPAAQLGRRLNLHPSKQHRQAAVKARVLSREKLRVVLEHVRVHLPTAYPLVLLLARTGLRIGEAVALQLGDVDREGGQITVARAWDEKHKAYETPKHGARTVELSPQLAEILALHLAGLHKILGLDGKPRSPWLFPSQAWTMLDPRNVRRLLAALAVDLELGRSLKPHDFRHTFASQLTAEGKPPQYIQQQLGHASVQITIDLYGSGLPLSYQHGVACLDDAPVSRDHSRRSGHKAVTKQVPHKSVVGLSD